MLSRKVIPKVTSKNPPLTTPLDVEVQIYTKRYRYIYIYIRYKVTVRVIGMLLTGYSRSYNQSYN